MLVLGVHGGWKRDEESEPAGFAMHDSAAALISDAELLAAIEEERLSRIKHSNSFPFRAIRRCLDIAGVAVGDIDRIAVNTGPGMAETTDKAALLEDPTLRIPQGSPTRLAALLRDALGVDVSARLRFCSHHLAHAWSAFAPSGFAESLILSIDGDGDNSSGMVLVATDMKLRGLRVFQKSQSLGSFYHSLIHMLGYSRFDEYKVMALAPYGNPRVYAELFANCYRLLPDGDYWIADMNQWFLQLDAAGLIAQARRQGEPFTQMHLDFAAAVQDTLEKIVMHVLQHYRKHTKERNLCLAGGVAHNCSLNGKILYSGLFQNVFVQPAAHDAGGALGAAWWALYQEWPEKPRAQLPHLFLGSGLGGDEDIGSALELWTEFLSVRKSSQIAAETAQLLASGKVVGWVQGRSEFGPRALGNRSILADPRPVENKVLINEMVKKREEYRPFAPAVLQEKVREYFEAPLKQSTFPFMIFVLQVKEHVRASLGAVTHVDGTARVQTVCRTSNPIFWDLINEFGILTGVPILLNTSFNNHAEPIVDSVDDAVACFLTTSLHYLVVGPYIVSKRPSVREQAKFGLVPDLPLSRKLVRRKTSLSDSTVCPVYAIESTKSRDFGPVTYPISRGMFSVLQFSDGQKPFSALLPEARVIDTEESHRLFAELWCLWASRMITLRPQMRFVEDQVPVLPRSEAPAQLSE